MTDRTDDPGFEEAVRRIANKIALAVQDEPLNATQAALANVVARIALARANLCDRVFLETVDNMFEVYRQASNTKLRNEDPAVS